VRRLGRPRAADPAALHRAQAAGRVGRDHCPQSLQPVSRNLPSLGRCRDREDTQRRM